MQLTPEILKACGFIRANDVQLKKVATRIPTNELNLNRWKSGYDDFWMQLKNTPKEQKQKIIVTDWSYRFSIKKPSYNYLLTLLELEFDIYVWTGELTKINSSTELLDKLYQVVPTHADDIKSECGLEAQSIKLVDYFETRRIGDLINGKQLHKLSFLDLVDLRFNVSATLKQIIASLIGDKPLAIKLSLDDFFYLPNDIIRELFNKVSIKKLTLMNDATKVGSSAYCLIKSLPANSPLFSSVKEIKISYSDLEIIKSFAALEKIFIKNDMEIPLSLSELSQWVNVKKLKSIKYENLIFRTDEELNRFLNDAPKLEVLYLNWSSYCDQQINMFSFRNNRLKALRLFLFHPRIDYHPAARFLESCPQLKSLEINQLNNNNQDIELILKAFNKSPQLKKIKIEAISSTQLLSLVKNHTQLEEFEGSVIVENDIQNRRLLNDLFCNEMTRSDLKKILLRCGNADFTDLLNCLFKLCPNLENMTVIGYGKASRELYLEKNTKLKLLNLPFSFNNKKNTLALFKHSEDLETFIKPNMDSLTSDEITSIQLPKLKLLDNDLIENLSDIFHFSPNLITLSLSRIEQQIKIPENKQLNNLKTIVLHASNFSFLKHCPNVDNLHLSFEEQPSPNFQNDARALSNRRFKKIKIVGDITLSQLFELLRISPLIKKLSIESNQVIIDNKNPGALLPLVNLFKLEIKGRNGILTDLSFLSKLMNYLPNITTLIMEDGGSETKPIDIPYCDNLNNLKELQLNNMQLAPTLIRQIYHYKQLKLLQFRNMPPTFPLKWVLNTINTDRIEQVIILSHDSKLLSDLGSHNPKLPNLVIRQNTLLSTFTPPFIFPSTSTATLALSPTPTPSKQFSFDEIDADTKPQKNASLAAKEYFLKKSNGQPCVNDYRLKVTAHHRKVTITPINNIEISKDCYSLREYYEKNLAKDNKRWCCILPPGSLAPHQNWQQLLSLTFKDSLEKLASPVPLEIGYSEETKCYYVRFLQPFNEPTSLAFIIRADLNDKTLNFSVNKKVNLKSILKSIRFSNGKLPSETQKKIEQINSKFSLKERISALASFCKFEEGELPKGLKTKEDIINALIAHGYGACRHRVAVFIELAKLLEIPFCDVINQVHTFAEVEVDAERKRLDLGGYDVKLIIEPPHEPKEETLIAQTNKREECLETLASSQIILNPFLNKSKTVKTHYSGYEKFCENIIQESDSLLLDKNILITFNTSQQIEQFYAAMAQHAQKNSTGYQCLHTFDDFTEKEFVVEEAASHTIVSHYLTYVKNAKKGDIFIFNLSDYNANTVAHCNALIDRDRKLAGVPLSHELTVIGVRLHTTLVGNDVYSRFGKKITLPSLTQNDLYQGAHHPAASLSKEQEELPAVDLYDGEEWYEQLCGKITIQQHCYSYTKGKLVDLLEKNSSHSLVLHNAPLHSEKFRLFLAEILNTKKLYVNGKSYRIPSEFKIITVPKQYDLTANDYNYTVERLNHGQFTEWQYELNYANYSQFFKTYHLIDGHMTESSGWIDKKNQDPTGVISILITETIASSAMARLLDQAKNYRLRFIFTPNAVIPQGMQERLTPLNERSATTFNPNFNLTLSNDLDLTVDEIINCHKEENVFIINVNLTTTYSDLIETIKKGTEGRSFDYWEGPLLKALSREQRTVILKGQFSNDLAQRLQSLWSSSPFITVNGKEFRNFKSNLIILTDDIKNFPAAHFHSIYYTNETIWQKLAEKFSQEAIDKLRSICHCFLAKARQKNIKLTFTYAQLKTMLHRQSINPSANILLPFLLLHEKSQLLIEMAQSYFAINTKSAETAAETLAQRFADVEESLTLFPCVFIVGPSGSGKTTFVLEKLRQKPSVMLFMGKEAIKSWANYFDGSKESLLVLDEANLCEEGAWDFFEGLFNKSPAILFEGDFYPLSPQHKVIFIGNPSYYAKRQHQSVFRHGAVIEFAALPDDYLMDEIMKPALLNLCAFLSPQEQAKIMTCFLMGYHFVNNKYPSCPLTPRNLENMILRFAANQHKENLDLNANMWLAAYDEIINTHKDTAQFFQAYYDVNAYKQALNDQIQIHSNRFTLTHSRKNAVRLLEQQLVIRQMKIDSPALNGIGGIRGFLFEGESATAKSLMTIEYLHAAGYHNGDDIAFSDDKNLTRRYYYLVSTLSPDEKEKMLLNAFEEGAIVVIDEFNCLRMEQILNKLMGGKNSQGNPPKQEGFFVIGTQNPASFYGRPALSPAMENRLHKIKVPDYQEDEIHTILLGKKVDEFIAKPLASYFVQAIKTAKDQHRQPLPNFRDLDRLAALILERKSLCVIKHVIKQTDDEKKPERHAALLSFKQKTLALMLIQDPVTFKNAYEDFEKSVQEFGEYDRSAESALAFNADNRDIKSLQAVANYGYASISKGSLPANCLKILNAHRASLHFFGSRVDSNEPHIINNVSLGVNTRTTPG